MPSFTYELYGFNSTSFENKQSSYKSLLDYIRENTDFITMYDLVQKATLKSALQLKIIITKDLTNMDFIIYCFRKIENNELKTESLTSY